MIDAFASTLAYLDHVAPIWLALWERGVRPGDFWVTPEIEAAADARGVFPRVADRAPGLSPLLVASYRDMRDAGERPIILAEHGAGQTYGHPSSHPSYAGGPGRRNVILFLVPSAGVGMKNAAAYPSVWNALIGCPKMDPWHDGRMRPSGGAVAISFHWDAEAYPETRSAFRHYRAALAGLPAAFGEVIGHAHPRWFDKLAPVYEAAGIEPVASFEEVLDRADVYACDNSSTIYEFASTGRPVAILNAPWYRRSISHGMRFWDHAEIGPQCDDPAELAATIATALEDPPERRAIREAILDEVYAVRDGTAASAAALAIGEYV